MKLIKNKTNQEKSKKNDRTIMYSFLTQYVFENITYHDDIQNINKGEYNNCRSSNYPF